MLSTKSKISEKNLDIAKDLQIQFFNITSDFKTKFNLDNATAQRLSYYLLLNQLALQIKRKLPFKIKGFDNFLNKSNSEYKLNPRKILADGNQFDKLYNKIKIDFRKKSGQILTPFKVADFMTSWGISNKTRHILDPAVGTGIFVDLSLKKLLKKTQCEIFVYDTDSLMLNATLLRIRSSHPSFNNLRLSQDDFLSINSFNKKFDFIICNPPYLNFHDYDHITLTKNIGERFAIKISQLTNIYSLFLMQSSKFSKNSGKIAFITPSEFFYTGYGKTLKKFLIENFTIEGFIIFNFSETLFDGILTTAVITLLVNQPPSDSHKVKFIKLKEWPNDNEKIHQALKSATYASKDFVIHEQYQKKLDPDEKWLVYFEKNIHRDLLEKLIPLSNIGTVNRGIATGYNNFFTISENELEKWNIEKEFFKPVLGRARHTHGYNFTKQDYEKLKENQENVLLLYCFEEPSEKLKQYLKYGEKLEVHKRFLCAHRKPWYSMEKGHVAPILATVFSRNKMRFIHNKAECLNLAAYHGIFLNFEDEMMIKALLCYLNSGISEDVQVIKRREYGGGLHKFEPGDLEVFPVLDVTKLNKDDLKILANLFDELCKQVGTKDENSIKKTIDSVILRILS